MTHTEDDSDMMNADLHFDLEVNGDNCDRITISPSLVQLIDIAPRATLLFSPSRIVLRLASPLVLLPKILLFYHYSYIPSVLAE